jgi:putative two-component system response regulator
MKNVFIIDNENRIPSAFKSEMAESYKIYSLPDAEKLIKLSERIKPSVILLYAESDENALRTLKLIKNNRNLLTVPVIFIAEHFSETKASEAFKNGVSDIIIIPFLSTIVMKRIEYFLNADKKIKEGQNSLRNIQNALISVIAELVEDRDKVTGGHIERTQQYLKILIDGLKKTDVYKDAINTWDLELLLPSAQLHDVGKITVSDLVLNKPGKLTDDEFAVIKSHAPEGERIIDEIMDKTDDDGFLMHAKMFAGYHHEKWNGSGYPRGLRGTEIPLEGRIMAIADVYDALVSARPYKKPFTHEQAVDIIVKDSGTHFDPDLIEVFKQIADDFWVQSFIEKDEETTPEINTKINDIIEKHTENHTENHSENGIPNEEKHKENALLIKGTSGEYSGKMISVDGKIIFGRGKICDVIFSGQTRGISSIHCAVANTGNELFVSDKNSTFGTFINGKKMSPNKDQKLSHGDEIWLGSKEESFIVV